MSLYFAKKLRNSALKRKQKHPLIRAFLSRILHPSKHLVVYTPANFDNPYQTLFYSGFSKTIVARTSSDKFLRYQRLGLSQLLHVHWDEDFFRNKTAQLSEQVREALVEYKIKGGGIIWTVHNEMPHEINTREERENFLNNRAFMCEIADVIHLHSEYAKQYLLRTFEVKEDKIVVIPHPSYLEWYCSAQQQREFRDKKVLLLFGNIRRYKGFDLILEALSKVSSPNRLEHFCIAGYGAEEVEYDEINGIKIRRKGGYVDDKAVPDLFKSADFAIFGFSSILTSGSLMLALTFGLPPIAPAHPSIKEQLPSQLHDLLYEPNNSEDFARVIDYATSLSHQEYALKSEVSLNYALENSPSKLSMALEKVILKLVNN